MDNALATVAYADIFDYPLTRKELHRWLLFGSSPRVKHIVKYDGFYVLPGRKNIIAIHKERCIWQKKKWAIAKRATRFLSCIPTVRLVGVTGGLAMNNAKKEDDIDLFIIASGNSLWTTRFFSTFFMECAGLRRRPNQVDVAEKICLNMFIDEQDMHIREHDCFAAHEILQMQPMFIRGDTYKKFLSANTWVRKYLPKAWSYRYVF